MVKQNIKSLILLIFVITFSIMTFQCQTKLETTYVESLCQNDKPDGFVDDWTAIIPIDPPPPAPFRLLHGTPVDLNQTTGPSGSAEYQVEAKFIVSMGTVGNIKFRAGSGRGVMAATAQVETALNSWQFTNNGWGLVVMTINYGSKRVELDFQKFNTLQRVELLYSSFYSGFRGRRGDIKFNKAQQ